MPNLIKLFLFNKAKKCNNWFFNKLINNAFIGIIYSDLTNFLDLKYLAGKLINKY